MFGVDVSEPLERVLVVLVVVEVSLSWIEIGLSERRNSFSRSEIVNDCWVNNWTVILLESNNKENDSLTDGDNSAIFSKSNKCNTLYSLRLLLIVISSVVQIVAFLYKCMLRIKCTGAHISAWRIYIFANNLNDSSSWSCWYAFLA